MKRQRHPIFFVIPAILLLLLAVGCGRSNRPVTQDDVTSMAESALLG